MIEIMKVDNINSESYRFTDELLTASFPTDEYRAIDEQRKNVESNRRFSMNIIHDDSTPIGLLSYWQFDGYIYIEHFAIHPSKRDKGYGIKVVAQIIDKHRNIVLEVERATDDVTARRIDFYRRCGLALCTEEYIQPAYRPDSNELPMHLMSCGVEMEKQFEKIKTEIHRNVYGK